MRRNTKTGKAPSKTDLLKALDKVCGDLLKMSKKERRKLANQARKVAGYAKTAESRMSKANYD